MDIDELRRQIAERDAMILDLVLTYAGIDETGMIESNAISALADAMRHLASVGMLVVEKDDGGRMVSARIKR